MTATISEIEAAYLATAQGKKNPGIAPDGIDVPGLRRVVISLGEVLVNGRPALDEESAMVLESLRARGCEACAMSDACVVRDMDVPCSGCGQDTGIDFLHTCRGGHLCGKCVRERVGR